MDKVAINKKPLFLLSIMLGLFSQSLFAQEDILKEFAEDNNQRKFCFYPSTIRMINLENDPEFNEMVKPLKKLLVYKMDSAGSIWDNYQPTFDSYEEKGFEEYATIFGNGYNVRIMGKDTRGQQYVGILKMESDAYTFYLDGYVNWQKLPNLMNQLQSNQFLDIMNFDANHNREVPRND
jgi:hypothetical protein